VDSIEQYRLNILWTVLSDIHRIFCGQYWAMSIVCLQYFSISIYLWRYCAMSIL